ncbi:succinate dehydrogenase/fumarate reductase iron-sulfur subunit [Rubrivivax gelatinosus]|uniref:succinate dehydrogenase n=1 Tax=Rubrivivax gelatinosus (strain NBRC 100245 / IL144) TaxID=983917 RepID=I0HR31_RUBGI|nr:succinate dehydrogenase/fumarate reductase iron-sulfur subunit [Rubrivivax gelatinosus]BAL95468.1 fumarate reductase iron-sulfur subunit FrdB [Rubrivivax gelatinosus IL144]
MTDTTPTPATGRTIEIECLRFNPETDSAPRFQSWQVPFDDDTSVLQGLQYIKDHFDGSLTFRWSCRMAICGSCGKMINGVPQLSCHAFLRDYWPNKVRVEPLANFAIVRDLVVDQNEFLDKLESVKPWIQPCENRSVADGPSRQTPAQLDQYYQFSQCINCLLCYAACPQVGLKPEFIGPAALALMHRYNADSRDRGWEARADVANAEEGVWGCTLVGYCSEVCPKGVDPAHAINQNKVNSTMDYFGVRKLLAPKGGAR